jgi:voltage-gated sodium channel
MSFAKRIVEIRHSKTFELAMIFVIIVSALNVGAHTYKGLAPYEHILSYLDVCITTIFAIEIVVRVVAEGSLRRFLKDPWNIFDTLIVLGSLIPLESSNLVFVGRLLRIFRVLRLISFVPELRVLLNALLTSLPRLGYLVLLMFIFFYIYGAFGATLFAEINPFLWGDILKSMLTLFRVMTFEDWTDVMYEVMEVYPLAWIYFLTFIFFSAFAFLNMLIGIVVDVVNKESKSLNLVDDDEERHKQEIMAGIQKISGELERLRGRLDKS